MAEVYEGAVKTIFRNLDFGDPGGITAPSASRVPLNVIIDSVEEEIATFEAGSRSVGYRGYIRVADHPTKPMQKSVVDRDDETDTYKVRNSFLDSTETFWELDLDLISTPPAPSIPRKAAMPAPGIFTWPFGIVENETV